LWWRFFLKVVIFIGGKAAANVGGFCECCKRNRDLGYFKLDKGYFSLSIKKKRQSRDRNDAF
jgi:hypothetical protein